MTASRYPAIYAVTQPRAAQREEPLTLSLFHIGSSVGGTQRKKFAR